MWLPISLSLISAVLALLFSAQLEASIQGAGLTGPEALLLLAPTLELIGGVSLVASRPELTDDEKQTLSSSAIAYVCRKWKGLSEDAQKAQVKSEFESRELRAKRNVERLEDRFSVSVLSAGFAVQILGLLVQADLPVSWFGWIMIGVALILLVVFLFLWPKWRQSAVLNGS